MLASALNPQLGWGAQWKGVVADSACIFVLHLLLEIRLETDVWLVIAASVPLVLPIHTEDYVAPARRQPTPR